MSAGYPKAKVGARGAFELSSAIVLKVTTCEGISDANKAVVAEGEA